MILSPVFFTSSKNNFHGVSGHSENFYFCTAVLLKTASVRVSSIQIIQVRVQNKGKSVWKSRYDGDISHSHTRLDTVCVLRCCAPIRTPAPLNFHPAAVTHFVPGINPQLEYFCTTGSTRRCGHLRLVTPRRPAVAPSPQPRHHWPVHLERVSREPHHHHENDMWASCI